MGKRLALKNESFRESPSLARGLNDTLTDIQLRLDSLESVRLAIVGPVQWTPRASGPSYISIPRDMDALGAILLRCETKMHPDGNAGSLTFNEMPFLDIHPAGEGRLVVKDGNGRMLDTRAAYTLTLLVVGRSHA